MRDRDRAHVRPALHRGAPDAGPAPAARLIEFDRLLSICDRRCRHTMFGEIETNRLLRILLCTKPLLA